MKICLFGGTFDPPHIGHLLIAQTICEEEQFEKVIFIPSLNPPHKTKRIISPVNLRVEMLKSAIDSNPHFEISEIEIQRGGTSFTLDTIQSYKKEFNIARNEIYFLMGSDSLGEFHTWKDPQKILKECHVIVALRPGFKPSSIPNWILHNIQFANIPQFEVSSSTIRNRWKGNKTIRYMVTQPVWEFINSHNLFF